MRGVYVSAANIIIAKNLCIINYSAIQTIIIFQCILSMSMWSCHPVQKCQGCTKLCYKVVWLQKGCYTTWKTGCNNLALCTIDVQPCKIVAATLRSGCSFCNNLFTTL